MARVGGSQAGRPARVRSEVSPRRLSQKPGRHDEASNGERVNLLTLSPADLDVEGRPHGRPSSGDRWPTSAADSGIRHWGAGIVRAPYEQHSRLVLACWKGR